MGCSAVFSTQCRIVTGAKTQPVMLYMTLNMVAAHLTTAGLRIVLLHGVESMRGIGF